jgi:hypothetical protein
MKQLAILATMLVALPVSANTGNGGGGGSPPVIIDRGENQINNESNVSGQSNPQGTAVGTVINQAVQNNAGFSKFGGGIGGFTQCASDSINTGGYLGSGGGVNATGYVNATIQLSGRTCQRFGNLQLKFAKIQLCDHLINQYLGYRNAGLNPDWYQMVSNAVVSIKDGPFSCALPFAVSTPEVKVEVREKIIYRDHFVQPPASPRIEQTPPKTGVPALW